MSTTDPVITPELVRKHNLTPDEYEKLKAVLGREPSYTELGIFSVMWSEHSSYKNTRPLHKPFPTRSPKILVGAGEENAGIIDIGDGLAIAFKIESHNHPSAVEPFQGAATGVGCIVRGIFAMGARPICSIDSLRFGPITAEPDASEDDRQAVANNRRLFAGVVAGIAHYGNCFGIPTIAGEVYFDKSYEGNRLVNAFCLGVLRHEQIARGTAKGVGNPVFYVGPATGRDGLAGAAFASQDLTEESAEQQRGAVQVGDPFMEKLVCEAWGMSFASRFPQSVDRMMAVSCPLDYTAVHSRLRTAPPANLLDWLSNRTPEATTALVDSNKADPQAITASMTGLQANNIFKTFRASNIPCLLVYGDRDPAISIPDEEFYLSTMTHQVELDASGHFPMIDEASKFNRLLTDFLALESGQSPRELQMKEEWRRRVR